MEMRLHVKEAPSPRGVLLLLHGLCANPLEMMPLARALRITLDAMWGLMTMVIILGGILSGVFTANESAAIAVVWAFFVTMFVYRDYRWRDLPKLVHRTVKTVTVVMILIGFAAAFGYALLGERLDSTGLLGCGLMLACILLVQLTPLVGTLRRRRILTTPSN